MDDRCTAETKQVHPSNNVDVNNGETFGTDPRFAIAKEFATYNRSNMYPVHIGTRSVITRPFEELHEEDSAHYVPVVIRQHNDRQIGDVEYFVEYDGDNYKKPVRRETLNQDVSLRHGFIWKKQYHPEA
jgi:hypothetical protein